MSTAAEHAAPQRRRGRPRIRPTNDELQSSYDSVVEMAIAQAADYYELSKAEASELRASKTRGLARIANARAMAMYLVTITLDLCMTRVGRSFGRDRTTVRHALARVEDARDNRKFDVMLEGCEERLRRAIALSTS